LALTSLSGSLRVPSRPSTPDARNSSSSGIASSPSTKAILTSTPCSAAIAATASAQPRGFMPPALLMTLMPRSTTSFSRLFIVTLTKSVA
jgi:hypothetical protein